VTILIKPQIVDENLWVIILMMFPLLFFIINSKKRIF